MKLVLFLARDDYPVRLPPWPPPEHEPSAIDGFLGLGCVAVVLMFLGLICLLVMKSDRKTKRGKRRQ